MDRSDRDDLLDALADLQHDLGKYIAMPLRMLPVEADEAAVRDALERALRRTRSGREGVQSARDLWTAFVAEIPAGLPALADLEAAVARALAWDTALDDGAAIDRARLEADFEAVGAAARAAIGRLRDGD